MEKKKRIIATICLIMGLGLIMPQTLRLHADTDKPTEPHVDMPETTASSPEDEAAVSSESEATPSEWYVRLMACASMQEVSAVLETVTEDVLDALPEEERADIEAHINRLYQAERDAAIEADAETAFDDEIVYVTVNRTDAAPLITPAE